MVVQENCCVCFAGTIQVTSERQESVLSPRASRGQEVVECKARNEGLTHRHDVCVPCSEGLREDVEWAKEQIDAHFSLKTKQPLHPHTGVCPRPLFL